MHSLKLSRVSKWVLLSLALTAVTPVISFAEDNPATDVTVRQAQVKELTARVKELTAKINAATAKGENTKSLEDQRDEAASKLKWANRKISRAGKKANDIEEFNAEKDRIKAEMKYKLDNGNLSQEERAAYDEQLIAIDARIADKKDAFLRKTGSAYVDKTSGGTGNQGGKDGTGNQGGGNQGGTTVGGVNPFDPTGRDPAGNQGGGLGSGNQGGNGNQGGSGTQGGSTGQNASDKDKMKNPACWKHNDKATEPAVYAMFPIGKSELIGKADDSGSEDDKLRKIFDKSTEEAIAAVDKSGAQRIWKIESTGYVSHIPMKDKSSLAKLAEDRGTYAANNFFSNAMNLPEAADPSDPTAPPKTRSKSLADYKTPDYGKPYNIVAANPLGGPAWDTVKDSKAYAKMLSTPVDAKKDAALVKSTAQAILDSKDFTPVKVLGADGKGDLEATTKKLLECCSTNLATLKYQPYQYMKLNVFGATFDGSSDACIKATTPAVTEGKGKDLPNGYENLPNGYGKGKAEQGGRDKKASSTAQ